MLHRRNLTSQSRSDVGEAVANEDPAAIVSAIPYWSTEAAILAAVISDAQTKVRPCDIAMSLHKRLKD